MGRLLYRAGLVSFAVIAVTWQPASAQVVMDGATNKKFSEAGAKLNASSVENASNSVGVTLMPGLIFTPQGFIESGFDTNPNRRFEEINAGFVRSGAALGLTAISERTIANLNASANWLRYFEETGRDERLSGNVDASLVHRLAPGLVLSVAGLYNHDASNFTPADTAAGSAELGYQDDIVSSFVRGRFIDVRYKDDFLGFQGLPAEIEPLFHTSALNAQRSEAEVGGLLHPKSTMSVYAEGGAAQVNYLSSEAVSVVNRNADDYHAKAGVRITFSPVLRSDIGWRWNWRDMEDTAAGRFNSDAFDGGLTWSPTRFFSVTASAERTIGEASTAFGLLADVRSYGLKMAYLPVPGVTISAEAQRQIVDELGANYSYHSTLFGSSLSYDYTKHIQLYTQAQYEYFDVDWRDLNYDRFKVMAGLRFIPDGRDPFKGASSEDLSSRWNKSHTASKANLTISTGYSQFDLPGVKMTTIVGGPFFDQAVGKSTDDDGKAPGGRIDVELARMAEYSLPNGKKISFGASGFYANYENTSTTSCKFTNSTDCAFVNIVDFSPTQENNTNAFGVFDTVTRRRVDYYGASVDARLGLSFANSLKDSNWSDSLKDTTARADVFPLRFGLAARGLEERTNLRAQDPGVVFPVRYDEKLDTGYYGGFVGIERQFPIMGGLSLSVDGTAGVYLANTTYQGRYQGYVLDFNQGYVQEHGSVNSTSDRGAFIGALKLGLSQDLGWGALGIYGQAEYLSYAPQISYNSVDYAGGSPWGLAGGNAGTQVSSGDAFNYTGGVSLKVKLK
jgi:hypothetical protein